MDNSTGHEAAVRMARALTLEKARRALDAPDLPDEERLRVVSESLDELLQAIDEDGWNALLS